MPFEEAPSLYALASQLPGIEASGVHMHIGSQITELAPFRNAFALLKELVAHSARPGLRDLTSSISAAGSASPIAAISPRRRCRRTMPSSWQRKSAGLGLRLLFEPGRMIAGNAGILVSRVLYVKRGASKTFTIVDAAMNDLMRPTLYEAYHEILPVMEPAPGTPTVVTDVAGPVCETGDYLALARDLPELQRRRSHFRDDGRRLWRGARLGV